MNNIEFYKSIGAHKIKYVYIKTRQHIKFEI